MPRSTLALLVAFLVPGPAAAADDFPPPESKGGWPSAVGDAAALAKLGIDPAKLQEAWDYNAKADGATGLLVVRHGRVVGEWYRGGDKATKFNIYSSSKAYTSLAYGLVLSDFGGTLPGGKTLALDTKVCNPEWLPESLPLPDPRKATVTVRHLLNMAGGVPGGQLAAEVEPFEIALGHTPKSPFAALTAAPGEAFNYSNAGVAHLVLLFNRAAGKDLYPFLKDRVLDPIGVEALTWTTIGGNGKIGPYSQGYSGVNTTPREHARFLYLALHKGQWAGKRIVPAAYYDFAWTPSQPNPTYGAQWWVYPRHKDAPKDLVQTAGANNNHGYVLPGKDLVFVRLGDGKTFDKGFEPELIKRVLAAVK